MGACRHSIKIRHELALHLYVIRGFCQYIRVSNKKKAKKIQNRPAESNTKKRKLLPALLFLLPAEDNNTLLVTLMRTPLQQWQPLSPLQQHHCTTTTTPLNPLRRWQPDQNTRELEYGFLFYYRMTILEVYMYYGITILK